MKQLDKLKKGTYNNKKLTLFLIVILIVGLITGSLFIVILNNTDKSLVKEYIEKFIVNTTTSKINYSSALISSLTSNLLFVVIVWLLGISVIGLPIMILLYFSKAFIIGFSIASMIYTYKLKGVLIAFTYVFPHHILSILVYTFLMVYSISLSLRMIKTLLSKKTLDFKLIMSKYSLVLLVSIMGVIIASLLEVFLMPNIIKFILPIIK